MIRKVLCLQYSEDNIVGKFNFRVNNDTVNIEITSSYVERNQILNIRFTFTKTSTWSLGPCYKIEVLNAKDETVFFLIYLDDDGGWTASIPSFCNISALKNENPDLFSRNSEDPMMSLPHIKMALTFGTKDELLPLSSATKIDKLSSIQMLRSILNETAFDDPEIEEGAFGKIIESCVDRLRNVIKVENAANILRLAKKYDVESLKEVAVKFVADNFREVMETSGWKEMPDHLRNELLSTVLLSLTPKKIVEAEQPGDDLNVEAKQPGDNLNVEEN